MSAWDRYIKHFVSYLKIERGLAENSISAYQNDVIKLADFAIPRKKTIQEISYADLKEFVGVLYDLGLSARSQARIISGMSCGLKLISASINIRWVASDSRKS